MALAPDNHMVVDCHAHMMPGFGYFLAGRQLAELAALLALIVVLKHSANIRRLLHGRESRIGVCKDKSAGG